MERCEVAIAGGGPVGMLLGILLARRGIDVRVLERNTSRSGHSRAIGIHPPGLACLAEVGLAEDLIARGVRVRRGRALGDRGELGAVSFTGLQGDFRFVLCVPQDETERALEEALPPGVLLRGFEVAGVAIERDRVVVSEMLEARFVVGADGKHSAVRSAAGIGFAGGPYPARFLMGDVEDDTEFGADAAIFLSARGLVESFPLPGKKRRWVASTGDEKTEPDPKILEGLVRERTGCSARAETSSMISAFTAERYLAERMVSGRAILAGDAAHVVSPIGGQGMNLGWLDARHLARALEAILRRRAEPAPVLEAYARVQRRAAADAIRRAEIFMTIGRPPRFPAARDLMVRAMLTPAIASRAAEIFTMRPQRTSAT